MRRWIVPVVLTIALAITGYWGYSQYVLNQDYKTHMDNIYQKSFYELVGNIGNVENGLAKLMVSGDKNQHNILLSEISRQSDAAQTDLGQLPISHQSLAKTYRYLNQLSDYAYYLNKKVADGKPLTVEEMDNLSKLYENCISLNKDLQDLNTNIQTGGVSWRKLSRKGKEGLDKASENIVDQKFVDIEKTSIDYPTLIYDGPFSDPKEDGKGSGLKGKTITEDQARKIAAEFIGRDRIENIGKGPEGKGDIDTYGFNIETKDVSAPIYVAVTKKGGKVLNMIAEYASREPKLSVDEAIKIAIRFLEDNGFDNMKATYEQYYDGVAVINFAYEEDDVIIYPDLIKVKVALDDGSILGFESRNYLLSHKDRDIEESEISVDEARKLVSPNLKVKSERLAIIPTDSKQERLCYEFKGEYAGNQFIVYIDANTGEEADILQIINTENGTLTM